MISVVTPWLNHSELCPMYARSVSGAQAVVVDNGSEPKHAALIEQMVRKLGGEYIRNETNHLFSGANNQGLAAASGEIVIFMNNDVDCRSGWLERVAADVQPGALYGPSLLVKHGHPYLEGWCIAGRREVWDALGGWEEDYYQGLYWEDNDLCFRAAKQGIELVQVTWPVWHFNNYTSQHISGARENGPVNEQRFLERVRTWRV